LGFLGDYLRRLRTTATATITRITTTAATATYKAVFEGLPGPTASEGDATGVDVAGVGAGVSVVGTCVAEIEGDGVGDTRNPVSA
jgi:hypothetical protein